MVFNVNVNVLVFKGRLMIRLISTKNSELTNKITNNKE